MSPNSFFPRQLSRAGPGLALAVALLFHLIWALLPFPSATMPETPPPPARLTMVSEARGMAWSPTFFSLPTAIGFSGVMRRETQVVLPPLDSPVDLSLHHPLDPLDVFPPAVLPPPERLAALAPITPESTVTDPILPPPSFRWTLRLEGADDLRLLSFRPPRVPSPPTSRRMTGAVEFDRHGQVTHLVMDPGSLSDSLRAEAATALRLARVQRGRGPVRARFELVLEPREERP